MDDDEIALDRLLRDLRISEGETTQGLFEVAKEKLSSVVNCLLYRVGLCVSN
jgi:hypothetical protein